MVLSGREDEVTLFGRRQKNETLNQSKRDNIHTCCMPKRHCTYIRNKIYNPTTCSKASRVFKVFCCSVLVP